MVIKTNIVGTDAEVVISGRIDINTCGELRKQIAEIPQDIKSVIFDFKDVEYISSAGIRELVICQKRFPGVPIRVINVNADVADIFRVIGFDSILQIEETENDTATYVNLSVKGLLKKQTMRFPDTVVLKGEHDRLTWKDIDTASQIIAYDLAELGVKKGTHVALCGANSLNWVLTFYAIQKLGAVAMLINPSQSAKEIGITSVIGDVEVFCYGEIAAASDEEAFCKEIKSAEGSTVSSFYSFRSSIDFKQRFGEYEKVQGLYDAEWDKDMPCTVIFTSGSTGRPKGVILSSYNLLNAAQVQLRMQQVTRDDKNLLIVPLFHILGLVVCLFPCALASAILYIPDNIRTGTLIKVMHDEKCTLFHSVPTMVVALLNNKDFNEKEFASLRCTLLAGAAATQAQLKMFTERLPNDHFMIAYGLSEMAPVSETLYDDKKENILGTVGKPVENIQIKIIDRETGETLKTGESGEILVQGFNLMTGYYKLPINDQAIDDEGWLRTGDMGYLNEEGYLCLSGRYKELIIRGGENIMPSEVESAVTEIEDVVSARVIGIPSDFFGEEVCACMTMREGSVFDEEKAKAFLADKLAKYKIPRYFLIFDEFPSLGSSKVDMVRLKQEALVRIFRKE